MKKIPKGLTDKDMVKNYVEEKSIEDKLIEAEAESERKRKAQALTAAPAPLAKAGLSADLADKLGRELLALKLELASEGVTSYDFKIKRDREKVTLSVINKKFQAQQ